MPSPTIPRRDNVLNLSLNRVNELFDAPDVDPFSQRPTDILGESGVDYLHRRLRQHWPRGSLAERLAIRLPQAEVASAGGAPTLAANTQQGLRAYCEAQIRRDEEIHRRRRGELRRQLAIVLPICAVAFGLCIAIAVGSVMLKRPYLQGVLIIVMLFIGSIALWDVLDELLFGWVPSRLDRRAYEVLGRLRVEIEPEGE